VANRAALVRAEAEVPQAMAQALRAGHLHASRGSVHQKTSAGSSQPQ
jgi:uncharacterized protein YqfA (UPF0365 family)